MQKIYIYELIDPITDETRYIGKTSNLKNRLYGHIFRTKTNIVFCYKENWIRSLLKQNLKPIMNIIDEVDESESNFWERFYISLYKSWNCKLTNLTNGGDGGNSMLGIKQSKQTINKRIETRKNNGKPWISNEQKEKMKINAMGNQNMKDKHHSEETKNKLSVKHKENVTEEFREKMRVVNLGNKNRKGKKCSEETKDKLRKPIIQLNLDKSVVREFKSYTEAFEITKIKGIANCLSGRSKSAGGFIWKELQCNSHN